MNNRGNIWELGFGVGGWVGGMVEKCGLTKHKEKRNVKNIIQIYSIDPRLPLIPA